MPSNISLTTRVLILRYTNSLSTFYHCRHSSLPPSRPLLLPPLLPPLLLRANPKVWCRLAIPTKESTESAGLTQPTLAPPFPDTLTSPLVLRALFKLVHCLPLLFPLPLLLQFLLPPFTPLTMLCSRCAATCVCCHRRQPRVLPIVHLWCLLRGRVLRLCAGPRCSRHRLWHLWILRLLARQELMGHLLGPTRLHLDGP